MSRKRNFTKDFETVKKEIKKYGIKNAAQYKKVYKIHEWPSNPDRCEEWISWRDLLDKNWPDINSLKDQVQSQNIQNRIQYRNMCKRNKWPVNPRFVYRTKWIGWKKLFGKIMESSDDYRTERKIS